MHVRHLPRRFESPNVEKKKLISFYHCIYKKYSVIVFIPNIPVSKTFSFRSIYDKTTMMITFPSKVYKPVKRYKMLRKKYFSKLLNQCYYKFIVKQLGVYNFKKAHLFNGLTFEIRNNSPLARQANIGS